MASLLLHACCSPCSTYTLKRLRQQGFAITAFWYNPNIHPFLEHQHRLESMRLFAQGADLGLIVWEGYDMIEFLRLVVGHEGDRCSDCYRLRLSRAAKTAREGGYSAFSTTLLISPYQKHNLLKEVGKDVAEEMGVEFYYEDLRDGFRDSRQMARELGLYRQQYCGCLFSEWERYARVNIGEGFRYA